MRWPPWISWRPRYPHSAPRKYKGTIISLRNILDDLGFAFSGVISGFIIDVIGVRSSLLVASISSSLLGIILVILSIKYFKTQESLI